MFLKSKKNLLFVTGNNLQQNKFNACSQKPNTKFTKMSKMSLFKKIEFNMMKD